MADPEKPVPEVPAAAPAPAAAAPAAAAPVAEAAPPAPVPSILETAEAPQAPPAEKPAEEAKPAEVAKPAEEKPAEPAKPAEEKPAEEKPAEAKPAEEKPAEEKPAEEKPAEVKAEEKPAEPPKLEPLEFKYEIPETIVMPDERRTQFNEALEVARTGDAQALIDLHVEALTAHDTFLRQEQFRIFGETKQNWRTQAMADEQIGGPAWKTSTAAIARMRDMFVSNHVRGTPEWKADYDGFVEALNVTGAGDHPAILKFIHNVARRFDEPAPPAIADVKLVPDTAGKKGNPLHDNPRSQRNGA